WSRRETASADRGVAPGDEGGVIALRTPPPIGTGGTARRAKKRRRNGTAGVGGAITSAPHFATRALGSLEAAAVQSAHHSGARRALGPSRKLQLEAGVQRGRPAVEFLKLLVKRQLWSSHEERTGFQLNVERFGGRAAQEGR